jgi:hypothetical protein
MDIVNNKDLKQYTWDSLKEDLQKNISGHFVLTGCEATNNPNFEKIVTFINQLMPKSIQINTNMIQPDKLSWFLNSVKNPIIAFDFKTTISTYYEMNPTIADYRGKFISSLFVLKSYIEEKNKDLLLQCRTTLYSGITIEKLIEMAEMLDVVNCKNFTWNFQDIYPNKEINSEIVKDWMHILKKECKICLLYNQEELCIDN